MGNHLVIAGHGKRKDGTFDPGATGIITKGEHRYVKEDLFPAMRKHLPKNHNVVFFDKYNVYSHGNIVALAKRYNADQITEVHFDAGASSASGGHVIIHTGYKPDKMDLALRDAIEKMVGVRYSHRGYKGISGRNNLANVNRTQKAKITYRLIELGFGTNRRDAKIMTEQIEAYARELVKAITGTSVKGISVNQGGLNVGQYEELKKLIDAQSKKIDQLESELKGKLNTPSTNDTPATSHRKAVEWAVNKGLSNGKKPYGYTQRQQTITMLYNLYHLIYPDVDEAGSSHKENMDWLVEHGISDGTNPFHPMTRQQQATILRRYHEAFHKQA